ncbi:hypothetical protein [Streptomyces sp. NPDC007984]|uniref:hypothetical protein n=1 Tax=Streptomyces sp. NPDC007984 TaxID=3364801 RepID=UPI0036EC1967
MKIQALPIAAYSIGKEDAYDLDSAKVAVINDCLTKKGTDFRLPPPPRPEDGNSRRYGVVDQGIAEGYGYHDPIDDNAAQPPPTPNPAQKKLLLGSGGSNDGCMAMADMALGSEKPPLKGIEAARTIDVTSFKESQRSPDIRKAFSEWSACMSRKGYEYASPLASAGGKWFATPTATESEKRVARADVACKNQVDLVERWHRAESKIQQHMIESHAKELKDLAAFQDRLVNRARNLLKEV